MNVEDIHGRLRARFGEAVGPLSEAKVDASCTVPAGRVVEICRFLEEEPELAFDFLEDLTAVDWPKREVIEVVYHLLSYRHRHAFVLKVEAARAAPSVPTVEGVWKAANWHEREVYDLFGVDFPGHPDLRRILLPDDWVGHPLRKDYQEAGGYHGFANVRENPLVELRRLDDRARVLRQAQDERASQPSAAPAAPAAPPATPPAPAPAKEP